jgi:hypothetical protein
MVSKLKLLQHCAEFLPLEEADSIPGETRGIYALLKRRGGEKRLQEVLNSMWFTSACPEPECAAGFGTMLSERKGCGRTSRYTLFGLTSMTKRYGSLRVCLGRFTART